MRLSTCACVCVCVNRLLERLMSPSPKSQVMFASAFSSHESVIFFVFLAFIVITYGHFVEYMNMHAMS